MPETYAERSAAAIAAARGKIIAALAIGDADETALDIRFTDGTGLQLFDNGQSCCEHRYMRTDDDLTYFVGATFLDADLRAAAETVEDTDYSVHEVQFLHVRTSRGTIVCANHNEHNGYYGGFSLEAKMVAPK